MMRGFGRLLSNARSIYYWSSIKRDHVTQLTRELLSQYRSYKPWKNIRIIHNLTMARYDPEVTGLEKTSALKDDQAQIHTVIGQLSGQLHQVPHQELNMLLEVLREREYKYNMELPIFRALNKQAKMLFGRQLKSDMLPMSLFYLKALNFPKLTIIKIFEGLSQILAQQGQKQQRHQISLTNLLKLAIICVEEPYIPFPTTKKMIGVVLKQNASTLSALCSLYHLSTIIKNCFDVKIDYQITKTDIRDILFNPYQQLEQQISGEGKQAKDEHQENNQFRLQLRKRLVDMSNEILQMFCDSVDAKQLQKAIVTSVQSDVEHFSKESILYACDIIELRNIIEQYAIDNVDKLTPVEMMYLAKRCSKEVAGDVIEAYLSKMSGFMSVQQNAYIYVEAYMHYHKVINRQTIFKLLDSISNINYGEFSAITRLVELLPSSQQHHIKDIINQIKQKSKIQSKDEKVKEDV